MSPITSPKPAAELTSGPAGTRRIFAAGPRAALIDHEHAFGPLSLSGVGEEFISVLEQSGLTGRGGAAFPSWRKISSTAQGRPGALVKGRPAVIANGAEGEPLSVKDKTLLAHAPHLVIDGLLIAAHAVSASSLCLYTTAPLIPAVYAAIAERRDAHAIKVVEAAETFISGQASAVVNAIGGGKAVPLDTRRRLSESGLKGRPTLVLNVETLAHIALIARYGARWFRSAGSDRDPGTRLLSVSGDGRQQVLEAEGDVRLREVLINGGIDIAGVQAVLIGGYHGEWVTSLDYRLSPSGLPDDVVPPGAGVIHVLHHGQCGLRHTARIVDYLAGQSAKQCGPCMFGLPALATTFTAIANGDRNPQLVGELDRLGKLVGGRGACHHPDGTLRLVRSAREIYAGEIEGHIHGTCIET